jgi:hypothetical protein
MAVTARTWGVLGVSGDLEPLFMFMGHSYVLLALLRAIPSPSRSLKAPVTAH